MRLTGTDTINQQINKYVSHISLSFQIRVQFSLSFDPRQQTHSSLQPARFSTFRVQPLPATRICPMSPGPNVAEAQASNQPLSPKMREMAGTSGDELDDVNSGETAGHDNHIEYPAGWTLAMIMTSVLASLFLVALVRLQSALIDRRSKRSSGSSQHAIFCCSLLEYTRITLWLYGFLIVLPLTLTDRNRTEPSLPLQSHASLIDSTHWTTSPGMLVLT